MKVHGTVTVAASQQDIWTLLLDPAQLCRVIPGCEEARQLDETHYEANMAVKVQFMTIRSKAQGTLLEAVPPRLLVAEMVGEPLAMAGAFRARLSVELAPVPAGTALSYTMDLTMLGRLASLGEALVRSTSQRLSAEFAANVSTLFSSSDAL